MDKHWPIFCKGRGLLQGKRSHEKAWTSFKVFFVWKRDREELLMANWAYALRAWHQESDILKLSYLIANSSLRIWPKQLTPYEKKNPNFLHFVCLTISQPFRIILSLSSLIYQKASLILSSKLFSAFRLCYLLIVDIELPLQSLTPCFPPSGISPSSCPTITLPDFCFAEEEPLWFIYGPIPVNCSFPWDWEWDPLSWGMETYVVASG